MALTAPRDTPQLGNAAVPNLLAIPVKANTKIYQGGQVAVDATGHLVPMAVATTLRAAGRARRTYDNTGGADGALVAEVERGIFLWDNAGADPVTQADVLTTVYGVDDATIARTNGGSTRSAAGTLIAVDADGAWVQSPAF